MRWKVQIIDVTGEDILADVLAESRFELEGNMLLGRTFEALDDWGDVADVARDLSQKVREISRLNPDIDIGFDGGPVFEYDANGSQISKHHKVYAHGTASLALTGRAVGIAIGGVQMTPEEKAEVERIARVNEVAEILRALMVSDKVLEVLRLFEGEPWGTQLGHIHDLIQDDVGDLSRYAPKAQLIRFNRSINHQDAFGVKARHAALKSSPPTNSMSLQEATVFIKEVAERWISDKAAEL